MVDFEIDPDETQALAELCAAACRDRELAPAERLPVREQRKLFREVKRLARGYRRDGTHFDDVVARITQRISRDVGFASILAAILLAGLAATVQFWVRRWWDRWFPAE